MAIAIYAENNVLFSRCKISRNYVIGYLSLNSYNDTSRNLTKWNNNFVKFCTFREISEKNFMTTIGRRESLLDSRQWSDYPGICPVDNFLWRHVAFLIISLTYNCTVHTHAIKCTLWDCNSCLRSPPPHSFTFVSLPGKMQLLYWAGTHNTAGS
jgi:hypothetical protein